MIKLTSAKIDTKYRKPNLPRKTCERCGLQFNWRKKWARDWEHIKYCSQRCRRSCQR
ncbi:MAG: DUF2256 domain-containing protein [Pseudomonadales bacterium]